MADMRMDKLIEAALLARQAAYAPYSHYTVGAALLAKDGQVFCGCNVENASYGAANCAERTAFFKAVSEGVRDFCAIAIAGGMEGCPPEDYAYPCGICRQVMQEFCEADFRIMVVKDKDDYGEYALREMLPCGFGGKSIR